MIEEYGTLSEEELLEEIRQELEATELDLNNLDLSFENGKLLVEGNLANEEEVEVLAEVLENYLDPDDYELDVDLLDSSESFDEDYESKEGDEDLEEKGFSELDEEDEDDVDFEEDLEEDDEDDNGKW